MPPRQRSSVVAPACTAIRPATSDIGRSSGSEPSGRWMVSYATDWTRFSRSLRVSTGSAARWRYVYRMSPGRKYSNSAGRGSFTFITMSARCHTSLALGTSVAPAAA